MSEETKRKISLANTGKKRSVGTKKLMSELKLGKSSKNGFKKGHTPWNKGVHITTNSGRTHFKKGRQPTKNQILALRKRRGPLHHNWKDGISKGLSWRASREYREWQQSVYRLYRWHCAICSKHCQREDIVAHHITPYSDKPELKFDINNGMVLCRSCHLRVHQNIKALSKKIDNLEIKESAQYLYTLGTKALLTYLQWLKGNFKAK